MSSVVPLKILDHYLLLTFVGDQQRERDSPASRPAGPRSMFFNVSRSIPPTSVPCVSLSWYRDGNSTFTEPIFHFQRVSYSHSRATLLSHPRKDLQLISAFSFEVTFSVIIRGDHHRIDI